MPVHQLKWHAKHKNCWEWTSVSPNGFIKSHVWFWRCAAALNLEQIMAPIFTAPWAPTTVQTSNTSPGLQFTSHPTS